jgi:hypothetical protein
MQLDEFISITLKNIIDGVADAQQYAKEKGGVINPNTALLPPLENSGCFRDIDGRVGSFIKFSLSLEVSEKDEGKAGVGVFPGIFGAGIQGSTLNSSNDLSNIQFTIPVFLPFQDASAVPGPSNKPLAISHSG